MEQDCLDVPRKVPTGSYVRLTKAHPEFQAAKEKGIPFPESLES